MARVALFALVTLMFFAPTGVPAADIESAYTSLDLDKCRKLTPAGEAEAQQGAEWVCPGYNGREVWVAEGDLRFFVGFGPDGDEQCSYSQTLSRFHNIHTTLEWRLRRQNGRMEPFATILRYFVEADGVKEQYLVVSRLDGDQACQMAFISTGQPNANQLARDAADRFAPGFECGLDRAFNYTSAGANGNETPSGNPECPAP